MSNTSKISIPLSGGWDSACAVVLHSNDNIFVFTVDYGHPYSYKELDAVKKICKKFGIKYKKFNIDLLRYDLDNMIDSENYTIPARNLFLAWLGSNFSNKIIIGSSLSDNPRTPDKSLRFYQLASATLSYSIDKDITVYTPFEDKTKMDMYYLVKEKYGKEKTDWLLLNTVSCHNPTTLHCGECLPCVKKWFVMKEANLHTKNHFIKDPIQSKIAMDMIGKLSFKK